MNERNINDNVPAPQTYWFFSLGKKSDIAGYFFVLSYNVGGIYIIFSLRHLKPKAGAVVTPSAVFPLTLMMPLTKHITG